MICIVPSCSAGSTNHHMIMFGIVEDTSVDPTPNISFEIMIARASHSMSPLVPRIWIEVWVGTVAKKRYQAVGFPCNRMLKLSSSRGTRIDVPVLSVWWSFEDHSVIIQALRKSSARPVILEESLAGSPLVQIVWQRLQLYW